MKIILCANTSWYLYNFCRTLTIELLTRGHKVIAIAPFDQHSKKLQTLGVKWMNIDLHQTNKNPLREIRTLFQLWRLMEDIQPDVVLTYTIKCNVYTGLLARLMRIKQIATITGLGEIFDRQSLFKTLICFLYTIAFKNTHKVFFQNSEDFDFFVQKGIIPEKQGGRIPGLGVNLSKFAPCIPPVNGSKRVFLMFGRLLVKKGYDLFLQAAQSVKHDYPGCAEFWILGIPDTSRKASELLFQKILEYHEKHIITYLPPTDDVISVLHKADVVVLPSEYNEGVPACLREALACGKPIITTNWKGCQETVDNGINGFLIERHDLDALISQMNFFINADNEILHKMGTASRKKAEKEFDERLVISTYWDELTS